MPIPITDAFSPVSIGPLNLKNRFIKSATYEGMTADGRPTQQLIDFHSRVASGGVALTTVAYGAVNADGRTHLEQLMINQSSVEGLSRLAKAIHEFDGKVSMQLTHCGFFTRNGRLSTGKPVAPSRTFNAYGLMSGVPFSRAMSFIDMQNIKDDFARSARLCVGSGFDAIELHMGHGYLLSQFLTPGINRRTDKYGGSIINRVRFPTEVLRAVKNEIGDAAAILVKINLSDGFEGGIAVGDTVAYIDHLSRAGADAFVLSGSYTSKTPFFLMRGNVPLRGMVSVEKNWFQKVAIGLFGPLIMKNYAFEENYFMSLAREVREAVNVPLVYQGGVVSDKAVKEAISEGFELIGMGRALIHDPNFIKHLRDNREYVSPCNHCNKCMVEMDRDGVRCVLK